ncbi:Mitochondrial-processing peptidase subunit alpha [Phlyctochytrium planicorne]|nr:Mitochondrial-processing peptidase subunit alpha [Phlyctochytrium planicorne]
MRAVIRQCSAHRLLNRHPHACIRLNGSPSSPLQLIGCNRLAPHTSRSILTSPQQVQHQNPESIHANTSTPSRSKSTTSSSSNSASQNPPASAIKYLEEPFPTIVSTLPNGLQVASQEAPGHFVTVGVYVDAGTRYETDRTAGASHVLDRLAFKSTENLPAPTLISSLETLGGQITAHSSRETMTYQASVFPSDLPETVRLLAEVVTKPSILEEEVEEVKETTRFEIAETEWKMDVVLPERLHAIAFGEVGTKGLGEETIEKQVRDKEGKSGSRIASGIRNLFGKGGKEEAEDDVAAASSPSSASASTPSTLGRPLLCDLDTLNRITPEIIKEYRAAWFTPDRMVLAGVGMSHTALRSLAEREFGHLPAPSAEIKALQKQLSPPPKYTGGILIQDTTGLPPSPNPDDRTLTHVYIAFEAPSMSDPDIYALATLSTLMGGGGSFSAGGPGKGMYTRLYTQVLNRFGWIESCNMLSFSYVDTGLFGITASVPPSYQTHEHIAHILCDQLHRMTDGFTAEELSRAKNQLKSNLLMSLESRSVELEDIARQVMVQNGKRVGVSEMCRRVDVVQEEDLVRVARRVVLGEEVKSPLMFGDEGVKHWKRRPGGGVSVLVHGPLVGGRGDPLRRISRTLKEWGVGPRN